MTEQLSLDLGPVKTYDMTAPENLSLEQFRDAAHSWHGRDVYEVKHPDMREYPFAKGTPPGLDEDRDYLIHTGTLGAAKERRQGARGHADGGRLFAAWHEAPTSTRRLEDKGEGWSRDVPLAEAAQRSAARKVPGESSAVIFAYENRFEDTGSVSYVGRRKHFQFRDDVLAPERDVRPAVRREAEYLRAAYGTTDPGVEMKTDPGTEARVRYVRGEYGMQGTLLDDRNVPNPRMPGNLYVLDEDEQEDPQRRSWRA